MSRTRTAILLLATVVAVAPVARGQTPDDDPRPKAAVLRAHNPTASDWWSLVGAERAQEVLIKGLAASGRFRVLGRQPLMDALAEEKILLTGELSPAGAVKIGRRLGVRYLVATSLTEFGTGAEGRGKRAGRRFLGLGGPKSFKIAVTLRLLDSDDGATIWADSRGAEVRDSGSKAEAGVGQEEAAFDGTLAALLEELVANLASVPLPAAGGGTDEPHL